jgi:hypothetical protein
MYLCICFLTSVPRITAARYNTPANGSGQGEEEEEDSDFSHARLFARASSSLLTVDSANFQRKVLLVEDTRINGVSKIFIFLFSSQYCFSYLIVGCGELVE